MLTVSLLLCALVALSRADGPDDTAAAPEPSKPAPSCPEGWTPYNKDCLQYVAEEMSWADAEMNCHKSNGSLASVHDVDEVRFINSLVPADAAGEGLWVGGSNCQQDDIWLWSDGSAFEFTFWCPAKPNNLNGNQHCLQVDFGAVGRCWNDVECDTAMPSMCRTNQV